jgi:hypothetical protein
MDVLNVRCVDVSMCLFLDPFGADVIGVLRLYIYTCASYMEKFYDTIFLVRSNYVHFF